MQNNYFKTINNFNFLEAEEEQKLAQSSLEGNQGAREKLINSHLRMVMPIARRFQKHNIPLDDLVQEGNLGLITAVDKFDPSRGTRLATYARAWIQEFIKRRVYKEHFVTDLPVKYVQAILQKGNEAELQQLEGLKNPYSLDFQFNDQLDNDNFVHLSDRLQDERDTPSENLEKKEMKSLLNRKIQYHLDEEELMIIEKRFFSKKTTYKEIGDNLNVSLETIRNKEKKALEKLKKVLKKDLLER